MSENTDPHPPDGVPGGTARARQPGHSVRHENPTTQQMRIVGQRRAEAEEKLAHHLEQARHPAKEEHPAGESVTDHH
ncbi:hypothetical protein QFZ69_001724 [Arthrobacter sp. V1I7]|uniref:hypothetical protein n=1 Tax=Arthrobacter sp. V1I7 TaxID=3042274 RepID=UPI002780CD7F|nr:hypothetical protein [Arthrobacter sp. V1I7]MDQ0820845.1 hypothetical protein [Arthrobacter sp. V1I7]